VLIDIASRSVVRLSGGLPRFIPQGSQAAAILPGRLRWPISTH